MKGSPQKTDSKVRCAVVQAGIHRERVGMHTLRSLATSRGGTPLDKRFLADSILLSVIWRFWPPMRPDGVPVLMASVRLWKCTPRL